MDAPVPAVAALEQVAADRHAHAVTGGKEQVLLLERGQQIAAGTAGLDRGGHRVPVNLDRAQARHIEQHAAVAEVVARPAVASGAHADPHVGLPRFKDGRDHVRLALGENDQIRKALGRARIPHGAPARLFIAALPSPERLPLVSVLHSSLNDTGNLRAAARRAPLALAHRRPSRAGSSANARSGSAPARTSASASLSAV